MKLYKVMIKGRKYEVFAPSAELAVQLIQVKFKLDRRRLAWARTVRPYKFK